ncbi:hypothetical protein ACIQVT_11990 [Streptomyces sp. NPDC100445]|uniref:hypothetical protein n=1 Tax=Streptomyces sp. NPDC100445 TaxID=3366102 RepID=UPI00382ED04F
MTSNGEELTTTAADEGIQQIPTVISVTEVPAATDTRDILLQAIGAEARIVADKLPGQASKALADLAHAYALVTAGTPAVATLTPPTGTTIDPASRIMVIGSSVDLSGSFGTVDLEVPKR